jgi:hypothetical protein
MVAAMVGPVRPIRLSTCRSRQDRGLSATGVLFDEKGDLKNGAPTPTTYKGDKRELRIATQIANKKTAPSGAVFRCSDASCPRAYFFAL